MFLIEGNVERELLRITLLRAPHEAAGLIIDGSRVIELPNHSDTPKSQFEMKREDILAALPNEDIDPSAITIWHSHPSGGIGPSRVDMRQKAPSVNHLVVSLIQGKLTCSWY